jgi:hypothetical protein
MICSCLLLKFKLIVLGKTIQNQLFLANCCIWKVQKLGGVVLMIIAVKRGLSEISVLG